jgi:DNA-binding transcriptional MerR regulator
VRIGELARRTGVSRRSLRYYERHDLIHARRGANGWREYDAATVDRVRTIADMIANGLTLDGVKELAPCLGTAESECDDTAQALRTYRARLAVVEARLAALQRDRERLSRRIRTLATDSDLRREIGVHGPDPVDAEHRAEPK